MPDDKYKGIDVNKNKNYKQELQQYFLKISQSKHRNIIKKDRDIIQTNSMEKNNMKKYKPPTGKIMKDFQYVLNPYIAEINANINFMMKFFTNALTDAKAQVMSLQDDKFNKNTEKHTTLVSERYQKMCNKFIIGKRKEFAKIVFLVADVPLTTSNIVTIYMANLYILSLVILLKIDAYILSVMNFVKNNMDAGDSLYVFYGLLGNF